MGEVWRATDERLNREVAVKLLSVQFSRDDLRAAVTRFDREGQAAARLNHPAIATVFDAGEDHGQFYLVFELLKGQDLGSVLARQPGGLPIPQVLSIGVQAAEGLAHAHESTVIHRDIKPANIMLLDRGGVKICDFGIAQLAEATNGLTQPGTVVGTVAYMSPEQLSGRPLTGSADVYSLGVTLFELLTGRTVFEGEDLNSIIGQHFAVEPPDPATLRPDCPGQLREQILAMLRKDPGERPTSKAVAAALAALRDGTSGGGTSGGGTGPGWSVSEPDPVLVAASQVEKPATYSRPGAPQLTMYRFILFQPLRPHNAVAFSPDGDTLIAGDDRVRMWDLPEFKSLGYYGGDFAEISDIKCNHSGTLLGSSARHSGRIALIHRGTDAVSTLSGMPEVREFAFSRDDSIVAACGNNSIGLFSLDPDRPGTGFVPDPTPGVHSVAFTSGGNDYLAAATPEMALLWRVNPRTMRIEAPATYRPPVGYRVNEGIAFTPDGTKLAIPFSRSADGGIVTWDIANKTINVGFDHAEDVRRLTFSPDGALLAGIGADDLIHLWDAQSRTCLHVFSEGSARSLAFSPDSRFLATVGSSIAVQHIARDGDDGSGLDMNRAIIMDGAA